jgi:hypothetical protein
VSGRQAATRLRDVLASDEQVRLLLRTGIAGAGTLVGGVRTFDEAAITELRLRRQVDNEQLARACPDGLYVARMARSAELDLTRPWCEVATQVTTAVAAQRSLTPLTAAITSVRIGMGGTLPFVATFLGFVVLAADLDGLGVNGPVLEPPGPWAHTVIRRRLHTARGGRPAYLWTPPLD